MTAILAGLVPAFVWSGSFYSPFAVPKWVALVVLALWALWEVFGIAEVIFGPSTAPYKGTAQELARDFEGYGAPVGLPAPSWALWGLVLALLASYALSADRGQSWTGRGEDPSDGLIAWAALLAVYLSSLRSARESSKMGHIALSSLALAGGAVGAMAVLERLGVPFPWSAAVPADRAVATLGSPVDLGAFLALAAPAAAAMALRRRPVGLLALAGILGGLVASGSRGGFLGLLAAAGAVFLTSSPASRGLRARGLAIAAAAAVLALGAVVARSRSGRIESDSARVLIMRTAVKSWLDGGLRTTIVGSGPASFYREFRRLRPPEFVAVSRSSKAHQAHAHNGLLNALATLGLLGLVACTAFAVSVIIPGLMVGSGGVIAPRSAASSNREDSSSPPRIAAAGLAAFAAVLMVDPVGIDVWAAAALLAGISAEPGAIRRSSFIPAGLVLVLFLGVSTVTGKVVAELVVRGEVSRAAAMPAAPTSERMRAFLEIKDAVSFAPWDESLLPPFYEAGVAVINSTADRTTRESVFDLLRAVVDMAIQSRPLEPMARAADLSVLVAYTQALRRESPYRICLAYRDYRRLDPLTTDATIAEAAANCPAGLDRALADAEARARGSR